MKKIIIPLIMLFLSIVTIGFSQEKDNDELLVLKNNLSILKLENNKLKQDLVSNKEKIDNVYVSLEEIKELYQGTTHKIDNSTDLLDATNKEVFKIQQNTNDRFQKYRKIIKYALILGVLAAIAFLGIILFVFVKFKKQISLINTDLKDKHSKMNELNNNMDDIKETIEKTNNNLLFTLDTKIAGINKSLEHKIYSVNSALEASDAKIKEQSENDLLNLKQSLKEQFDNELLNLRQSLKEQSEQINNLQIEAKDDLNKLKSSLEKEIGLTNKSIKEKIDELTKNQ